MGGTDLEEVEEALLASWEEVEGGSQEEAPCHRSEVEEAESLRAEDGNVARLAEGGRLGAASLQAWRVKEEEEEPGRGPAVEGAGRRLEVVE